MSDFKILLPSIEICGGAMLFVVTIPAQTKRDPAPIFGLPAIQLPLKLLSKLIKGEA